MGIAIILVKIIMELIRVPLQESSDTYTLWGSDLAEVRDERFQRFSGNSFPPDKFH